MKIAKSNIPQLWDLDLINISLAAILYLGRFGIVCVKIFPDSAKNDCLWFGWAE